MPLEVASIQCKSLPNKKDVELFAEVTDESILVLGVELTTATMLCLMHVWKPLCLKVEGALWTKCEFNIRTPFVFRPGTLFLPVKPFEVTVSSPT